MPAHSGVAARPAKPNHRLTDAYYKLEHDEWQPQIIDDPKLPGYILKGGRSLSLKLTRLRDEVVTWLLFESGGRRVRGDRINALGLGGTWHEKPSESL